MAQYEVSRGTIRKAINPWSKRVYCLLKRVKQRRLFNTVRHAAEIPVSFAAALRDGGFEYRTEVLFKQVVFADQAVEHLEIPIGSDVLRVARQSASTDPWCQERSNLLV